MQISYHLYSIKKESMIISILVEKFFVLGRPCLIKNIGEGLEE